ncbi:MAG: transglutaminase domain-containing protein [Bacillota bacterium]|nr:transglutaminase domain-containing protein [Bacillota bacterium]
MCAEFLDALCAAAGAAGRPIPPLDTAEERLRAVFVAGLSLTDAAWLDKTAVAELFAETAAVLAAAPWTGEITDADIWHYILQPRINEEALLPHRGELRRRMAPLLSELHAQPGISRAEVALAINRWCAERVHYEASDSRCLDPLAVLERGRGRCGEESTLVVACLRAAGIPARQVYAPRWLHVNDNHAWVEVRTDEFWHFLGACEPEPWLDHGWFCEAAQQTPLVVARRFGFAAEPDPEAGSRLPVRGLAADLLRVTERYAQTRTVGISLILPADTLHVSVEPLIPNWGQLAALSQFDVDLKTARPLGDGRLEARFDLDFAGSGLVLRLVSTGPGGRASRELTLAAGLERAELAVDFTRTEIGRGDWRRWNFELPALAPASLWPPPVGRAALPDAAPEPVPDSTQDAEQPPTANAAFDHPLALSLEGHEALAAGIGREAGKRAGEWLALLENGADGLHARLLRQLRAKDLSDTDPKCVVERVALWRDSGWLAGSGRFTGLGPQEVDAWALGLRVADEKLLPFAAPDWAGRLPGLKAHDDPRGICLVLESLLDIEREWIEGSEAAARWLPPALLVAAGRGNRRSVDLLAVTLARLFGWAARLGAGDGCPEVWIDGAWHRMARAESETDEMLRRAAPGELRIGFRSLVPGLETLVENFVERLDQHENFGVARRGADGFYEAVQLELRRENNRLVGPLAAGSYRLTLVQRRDEAVTAVWRDFALKGGEQKEIAIEVDDDLLRLFAG